MMASAVLNLQDMHWLRAFSKERQHEPAPHAVLAKLLALKLATDESHGVELTAQGRLAVKLLG